MRIYELERYVERLESRLSVAEEDCADALKTVDALRDDLAASENEIVGYQRAAVESEAALAQATERAESLSRELLAAIQARDSYRASADLRVGMRREFEELLGCGDTTGEEAFERGLIRLRALLAGEAKAERLAKGLREIETRTGHFGEAPPPPEWMPMLSLIAWVGKTARATLAEVGE